MNESSQIEILQKELEAAELAFNSATEAYNTAAKVYDAAKKAYDVAKGVQYHARVALAKEAKRNYYETQAAKEAAYRRYSWAKYYGIEIKQLAELQSEVEKLAGKVRSSGKLYDIHCAYSQ